VAGWVSGSGGDFLPPADTSCRIVSRLMPVAPTCQRIVEISVQTLVAVGLGYVIDLWASESLLRTLW
jgi:hypothetical protein